MRKNPGLHKVVTKTGKVVMRGTGPLKIVKKGLGLVHGMPIRGANIQIVRAADMLSGHIGLAKKHGLLKNIVSIKVGNVFFKNGMRYSGSSSGTRRASISVALSKRVLGNPWAPDKKRAVRTFWHEVGHSNLHNPKQIPKVFSTYKDYFEHSTEKQARAFARKWLKKAKQAGVR